MGLIDTRGIIPTLIASLLAVGVSASCGGTSVADLGVGDCFDGPRTVEAAIEVAEVTLRPCRGPHELQVFASRQVSGSYPDQEDLLDDTTMWCVSQFRGFVGIDYEDSIYFITQLVPSAESWNDGDREVLCLLTTAGGASTGTALNTQR